MGGHPIVRGVRAGQGECLEVVEEDEEGGWVCILAFQFEGACEGDSDEDFEVVGESCDECEEFLGHSLALLVWGCYYGGG